MLSLIKNSRHFIILIGILLLILGTWYFLNNRKINETPERADLVFNQQFIESVVIHNG